MKVMKKKTNKNLLNAISVVYFLQARLFTEIFSRTSTIHQGIFLGRALCEERNIRWETLSRHVINLNQ